MLRLGKDEKRVRDIIDGSGTVLMVSHSQGLMMEIYIESSSWKKERFTQLETLKKCMKNTTNY